MIVIHVQQDITFRKLVALSIAQLIFIRILIINFVFVYVPQITLRMMMVLVIKLAYSVVQHQNLPILLTFNVILFVPQNSMVILIQKNVKSVR